MKRFIQQTAVNPNSQILVGLMWSFSALLVKMLTSEQGLNIFFISSVRSTIGFFFLLPLILVNWTQIYDAPMITEFKEEKISGKPSIIMLLGGLSLAANTFLLLWCFEHTSALTPMFMHFSGVLLVAPVGYWISIHSPSKREWIVCALTLLGLIVLLYNGLVFHHVIVTLVSLAVLLTQLGGQLSIAWLSNHDELHQQLTGTKRAYGAGCFFVGEILTIVVGFFIGVAAMSSAPHLNLHAWVLLVLLGAFTWGIPNFLCLLAVRTVQYVSLALLWLFDPIGVPLWPVLVGYDPMPPLVNLLGAALILVALVIKRMDK